SSPRARGRRRRCRPRCPRRNTRIGHRKTWLRSRGAQRPSSQSAPRRAADFGDRRAPGGPGRAAPPLPRSGDRGGRRPPRPSPGSGARHTTRPREARLQGWLSSGRGSSRNGGELVASTLSVGAMLRSGLDVDDPVALSLRGLFRPIFGLRFYFGLAPHALLLSATSVGQLIKDAEEPRLLLLDPGSEEEEEREREDDAASQDDRRHEHQGDRCPPRHRRRHVRRARVRTAERERRAQRTATIERKTRQEARDEVDEREAKVEYHEQPEEIDEGDRAQWKEEKRGEESAEHDVH